MCCHSNPSPRATCGCGCAHEQHPTHRFAHRHYPGDAPGGLGVRRPLRFLAWKLELDPEQVAQLAAVLNSLKTERAQASVDDRRALAMLADAVQTDSFDRDKASEAAKLRTQSAERLQLQVAESLARIHTLLKPEQRARLAYLLRTGTLLM
ncbi:MAG: periplasmic heavy metal sensor [Candidatus Eisenbacteria bacterium]|uniref:Periplasmic heavy metal sensor n=1 Tax=Eiseniibacteriota bacterium TaxID=2212470 RepID=A0A538T932_UNCEI|nr:MAG: periplasmic heavy metal sensor [Candidatus Eisenbacteria bacterium]